MANIQFDEVIVIAGCGPIGLGMIAASKQKSPKFIVALDFFDAKLDLARECGADFCFNPEKVNVQAEIETLTEGYGCDTYFEVTGNPKSVQQGLDLLTRRGKFICMSVFKNSDVNADWSLIGDVKELQIIGGHLGPHCWPKAISMVSKNQLPLDKIITHKFPLSEFDKGIKMVVKGSESIKVMLYMDPK